MKYNVGDKVRIKSLDWYYDNKDIIDEVECDNTVFIPEMVEYCEKIVTISSILPTLKVYRIKEDGGMFNWTDEMFEELVEEETKSKFKVGDKVILDPYPCIVTDVHWRDSLHGFVYTVRGTDFGKIVKEDELIFDERTLPNNSEIIQLIKNDWNNFKDRYDIPDDYHFVDKNGNEINISEIVLEKKKKEYPKTYEECCAELNNYPFENGADGYKFELLSTFQNLIICRDAYWKIAGEEMELGKPWEPDYKNENQKKYTIFNRGDIVKGVLYSANSILAFPTEEMRDAFYENFKEEIEICKELL